MAHPPASSSDAARKGKEKEKEVRFEDLTRGLPKTTKDTPLRRASTGIRQSAEGIPDNDEILKTFEAYKRDVAVHLEAARYTQTKEALAQDLKEKIQKYEEYYLKETSKPAMPLDARFNDEQGVDFTGVTTKESFLRLVAKYPDDVFEAMRHRSLMAMAALEQVKELHSVAQTLDYVAHSIDKWVGKLQPGHLEGSPLQENDKDDGNAPLDARSEQLIAEIARRAERVQELEQQVAEANQMIVDLTARNREVGTGASASRSEAYSEGGTRRSDKLPDPPIFHNEKSKDIDSFEAWFRAIKNKMQVNADRYADDRARQAYVESRIGGNAKRALEPYLADDHPEPVDTSEKLLVHLWGQYHDPNKVEQAFDEWSKLRLRPGGDFLTFKNDFVRLAGITGQNRAAWKSEFNRKLNPGMKRSMAMSFIDPAVSFDNFVFAAQQIALIDKQASEEQASNSRQAGAGNRTGQKRNTPLAQGGSRRPAGGEPAKKDLKPEEMRLLVKEGRCFICREKGHMSDSCPQKPVNQDREARLKALEAKWCTPDKPDTSAGGDSEGKKKKARFADGSDSEN